jgi:uroporphyrinogen-III synthase
MKSKVVAILETRAGAHLGEMIERRGAAALLAPALEEVPDVDPQEVAELLQEWRREPFHMVIFQTGVGTRALFEAVEAQGAAGEFQQWLAGARIVVRGPKPSGELSARAVRIDLRAAAPFTTETVLAAIRQLSMQDSKVLVQRYGASNPELLDALRARGAKVREIATYRWSVPRDVQPLIALLDALDRRQVDATVFTSAVQMHNLHTLAEQLGRAPALAAGLRRTIVASIGPVCSRALRQYGIEPTFEASPPKLGPLLAALDAALASG